jgi:hypothetical protein
VIPQPPHFMSRIGHSEDAFGPHDPFGRSDGGCNRFDARDQVERSGQQIETDQTDDFGDDAVGPAVCSQLVYVHIGQACRLAMEPGVFVFQVNVLIG